MHILISFIYTYFSILFLQTPTDYPPIRTKEVPEGMQNPVIIWMIVGGILLLLLLAAYFLRVDKRMTKWFRR